MFWWLSVVAASVLSHRLPVSLKLNHIRHKIYTIQNNKSAPTIATTQLFTKRIQISYKVGQWLKETTTRLFKENTTDISLNSRYPNNNQIFWNPWIKTLDFMNTLLASKQCILFCNYTCSNLFAIEFGFILSMNMKQCAKINKGVKIFFKTIDVPMKLTCNCAWVDCWRYLSDL